MKQADHALSNAAGRGRILITGGCGFIGSNLAAHYLAQGWEVAVYDNFSRPGADANAAWLAELADGRLSITVGDVRNYSALSEAMQGADVVAHLAAQVAVTTSIEDPQLDFMVNALGGFHVAEAARRSPTQPIVLYASTNKVYGALSHIPLEENSLRYQFPEHLPGIAETFPIDLYSPYGCSKGAIDLYMQDYSRMYGLKTVVFRQSCIYGPRQFGVEDQGWVAHFVISAMLGRPITIYGDGRQLRDLLHVRDLMRAFDLAIEHIDACSGRTYNLGGGPANTLSLLELIHRLEADLGRSIPVYFEGWRPGDQKVYVSDVRRAERDFNWRPRISVDQGLHELQAWVAGHLELFPERSVGAAITRPAALASTGGEAVPLQRLSEVERTAQRLKQITASLEETAT